MDLAGGKRVGRFLLTDNDQPYMNETSSLVRVVGSDDLFIYSCQERVRSNVDGGGCIMESKMATRNVLIILFLGRLSQGHCPCWLSV